MQLKEVQHSTTVNLYWHNYKFFPYERALAIREIEQLLLPNWIRESKTSLEVYVDNAPTNIEQLVYFSHAQVNDTIIETIQHKFERTINNRRRQNTRYSVHGLHEYKGKFNPQVVRSLFNIFGLKPGDSILDPFCGSGTTLVEANHAGILARGTDINPLAVLIANTKIIALNTQADEIKEAFKKVVTSYFQELKEFEVNAKNDRITYLKDWFPADILRELEFLYVKTEGLPTGPRQIIRVIISNLLRDYSYQEPKDLRIRRRKTPLPTLPFFDALSKEVALFISNLGAFQLKFGLLDSKARAIHHDIRQEGDGLCKYDFAITSPPYATALPYIDTQRLSLVWLNLISPNEIRRLESELIGSREFNVKAEQQRWSSVLQTNSFDLPIEIFELCQNLQKKLTDEDGFRKKALPSLLYRYFYDMRNAFKNVHLSLKQGGCFALIVGHNHTMIGGNRTEINTPQLLTFVGNQIGFKLHELTALEAYQRFGLHASNAVQKESLIVFRK